MVRTFYQRTQESLTIFGVVAAMAMVSTPLGIAAEPSTQDAAWSQWRGNLQNGVAPEGSYPTEWSERKLVKWKVDLPGRGGSTPVVSGGLAFVTTGVDGKNKLMALDIEEGTQKWSVDLGEDRGNKHRKGSGSNPSPVTDGEHVFAYFRSGDIACTDLSGKVIWQANLQDEYGEDTLWWDLGTSPMIVDDLVVVAVMQTGPSFLAAYDRNSGELKWKADRMLGAPEEAAQSYSTPVVLDEMGAIAVMGADHLTLHSTVDGRELGRVGGFNPSSDKYFRSISSPVAQGDLVICPYSRGETITACRASDVSNGAGRKSIVWHRDDLGSDVPTPAIANNQIYVVGDKGQNKGSAVAIELETGKTIWTVKFPRSRIGYSSSPVVAGNHLYVTGEDATTYVIGPLDSDSPSLVATNRLEDSEPFTVASPVPVDGNLLIRTRNALYRIGE